jgi:wobble nucleotide-excising tRNase
MLKKVISIENVGKFRACKARGDVEMRRLTLIYAENGRGKTTLCEVLRSLATGDASRLSGRTTLGGDVPPSVSIRTEAGNVEFRGGAWSRTCPDIEVFDGVFVHENVHAGEFVETEQRRGLYGVIIGAAGVALQRAVDALDGESREGAKRVRDARVFERHVPSGMNPDLFLSLEPVEGLEGKLVGAEAELAALERSAEILGKEPLGELALPELPADFEGVLATSIHGVSADVASRVRKHREAHTAGATEAWLEQGVRFQKGAECPFCGQGTAGQDLVVALGAFFGERYRALQDNVRRVKEAVGEIDSQATRLRLSQAVDRNRQRSEFWQTFVQHQVPTLQIDVVIAALARLKRAAEQLITRKEEALLEQVEVDEDFRAAREELSATAVVLSRYNEAVRAVNARIAEKKGATAAGDLAAARTLVAKLRSTKIRFSPESAAACAEYVEAVEAKQRIEDRKDQARRTLDTHSKSVLPRFQYRINELLEHFGADFRIRNVEGGYPGGRATSTYQLVVNEVPVDLGDPTTSIATPSFRNTLSAGDRSALALSIFLARLELDPRLSEKIVVFDDPFSSQDSTRRKVTQQRICRLAKDSKQVIVLSHEASFLRLIYDATSSADVKTLQLARVGLRETMISEWDVVEATRGDYPRDHAVLLRYANEGEGDLRSVARTIRPVLEGYLRFVFPHTFDDTEWLGDFIDKIRQAPEDHPLASMKPALAELEDINEFSKKHHHQQNPGADSERIDGGELTQFVKRTLKVVGAAPAIARS